MLRLTEVTSGTDSKAHAFLASSWWPFTTCLSLKEPDEGAAGAQRKETKPPWDLAIGGYWLPEVTDHWMSPGVSCCKGNLEKPDSMHLGWGPARELGNVLSSFLYGGWRRQDIIWERQRWGVTGEICLALCQKAFLHPLLQNIQCQTMPHWEFLHPKRTFYLFVRLFIY